MAMKCIVVLMIFVLCIGMVSAQKLELDLQGHAEGIVNVQKGSTTIVIVDVDDLPKIHGFYEGWLVDLDSGYKLSMGVFNTNLKGRGKLQFRQKIGNFHIYDKIVITSEPLHDADPNPGVEVLHALIPGSLGAGDHGDHGNDSDDSSEGVINVPTGHAHGDSVEVDTNAVPTIDVTVTEDPKSGWNVYVTTTHFDLAPQFASMEHVQGQGHMHLIINGMKVTRMYGDWYHIPKSWLGSGMYEITVALSANDHRDYVHNGEIVQGSDTIHVS